MLDARDGIKLSCRKVGEISGGGSLIWFLGILKGTLKIGDHEIKVNTVGCFSPSSFILQRCRHLVCSFAKTRVVALPSITIIWRGSGS